ncbi:MAG: hypothetical protein A2Y67_04440 [Candidatus Buchananbacteria bacterium RBG_13_39_9]|uniref:Uncharacterized protein n=1 Tax=Candidatus Buchananbacteria bacterium RBG_13_39_9 TaxID=1797531 RepID=A0A1G1XRM9_9BACT|nr:MAG: hypothetical protein A2Y67_04440 [Candidatus Buchananbacteria bacterium RBG_13_39_9]
MKQELVDAVNGGIGFFCMFFLIFWAWSQLVDPYKISLLAQVPAWFAGLTAVCLVVSIVIDVIINRQKHAASSWKQNYLKIKKQKMRRIIF